MITRITSAKVREAAQLLQDRGELGKGDFIVSMTSAPAKDTYCMLGAISVAKKPNISIEDEFDFKLGVESKFYKAVKQAFSEYFSNRDFAQNRFSINDYDIVDAIGTFNDRPDTTLTMAVNKLNEIADLMDAL